MYVSKFERTVEKNRKVHKLQEKVKTTTENV